MNNELVRTKELLQEIRIIPVRGPEHTLWNYYFGITDFERVEFDCQVVMGQNNKPIFPP